jgi:hypothetical protein
LQKEIGNYFKIQKKSFEYRLDIEEVNEENFIDLEKEVISIKDVISFKYISARRDVTNKEVDKTLSRQTSNLYKKRKTVVRKIKLQKILKTNWQERTGF